MEQKIIVSQYGARRRYLVPRILYEEGLLTALYTDSFSDSLFGKLAKLFQNLGLSNSSLGRVIKRNVGFPKKFVKGYDGLQFKLLWNRLTKGGTNKNFEIIFEGSSKQFIKWGCKDATILYNMFIENIDFAKYAKSKGLKVISDIYENPYIFKVLAAEIENCPEYSCVKYLKDVYDGFYELRMRYIDDLLEISDAYLIPSQYVIDELRVSPKFDVDKANLIPYASSIRNKKYKSAPVKGRIIWIGNDSIRKGIVYCERAAKVLKEKYPFIEFRIIGSIEREIVNSEAFSDLTFVGHVDKQHLEDELCFADMYVFPTLSEGFAGSLLEAASYGVPIITTHASGCAEDFPCIFIPTHNTESIVNSVELLLINRKRRDELSHEIFNYSQNIDEKAFKNGLVNLINSFDK